MGGFTLDAEIQGDKAGSPLRILASEREIIVSPSHDIGADAGALAMEQCVKL
jgi:hypothetical protein